MNFPSHGFDLLKDVHVRLSVELGRTEMTLREVLMLGEESVVMLDRLTDELLDVMVNGKLIARGEIISENNRFGLRIVELAGAPPSLPGFPAPGARDEDEIGDAAMLAAVTKAEGKSR